MATGPADAPASSRQTRPVPRDFEARFTIDELFFSTTDHNGRIRSGNHVFTRTSGYQLAEMQGQPHSLIRHPDMPRTAFKLLWESLEAGEPFAAYVKNLSKDGSYYWVMAYVVSAQGGYLSIRLKPTTELFDVVKTVYGEMLKTERSHEDGTRAGREAGMEASRERLLELLGEHGFTSYDGFMHTALVAEVTAREEQLVGEPAEAQLAFADQELVELHRSCQRLHELLDGLVGSTREYSELNEVLENKARFILSLAESIRVFSLNALLASSRLGDRGVALGAVASLMRERSDAIAPIVHTLDDEFPSALGELEHLAFRAAAGKLQTEMASMFVQELAATEGAADSEDLRVLARCLAEGVDRLFSSLDGLAGRMSTLLGVVWRLEAELDRIRSLEVNGRVEDARLGGDGRSTATLFATIGEQVRATADEIQAVKDACSQLASYDTSAETSARREVGRLLERVGVTAGT